MIETYEVRRDDRIYQAMPDVAMTASGTLVCAFAEWPHHHPETRHHYSAVALTTSEDRGRTWSEKRSLAGPLRGTDPEDPSWNCPRIVTLNDGRLVVACDRVAGDDEGAGEDGEQSNWLWVSDDEGESWAGPQETPVEGIVPDQLIELERGEHVGRWLLAAHTVDPTAGDPSGTGELWQQRLWYTDDEGGTWTGPITIAADPDLQLCEGSVLELPSGDLVCFMRENSGRGLDCFKAISEDGGETWEGPYRMPIPGCHRPVAGLLNDGQVLITHRFMQGGDGWLGWWTQNTFAALTDVESCLACDRQEAHARIMPLDYDRSPAADTGYTGWVQFDDGEIYVVNYVVDDAPSVPVREDVDYDGKWDDVPKAHVRGYAFDRSAFRHALSDGP